MSEKIGKALSCTRVQSSVGFDFENRGDFRESSSTSMSVNDISGYLPSSTPKFVLEEDIYVAPECTEWFRRSDTLGFIAVSSSRWHGDRQGRVSVYSFDKKEDKVELVGSYSKLTQIFGLQWRVRGNTRLLAAATGDGWLNLISLNEETNQVMLRKRHSTTTDASREGHCLSCNWDPFASGEDTKILTSRSDGCIAILNVAKGLIDCEWLAHVEEYTYEPLHVGCTTYHKHKQNVVFSGDTDGTVCMWDLKSGKRAGEIGRMEHSSQGFASGVTCMQFHPLCEHVLATGAGGHIRLWDDRKQSKPFTKPIDAKGYVSKLKWHPTDPSKLAAACGEGGLIILRYEQELEILHRYRHPGDSNAGVYGVDWAVTNKCKQTAEHICASGYSNKLLILKLQNLG